MEDFHHELPVFTTKSIFSSVLHKNATFRSVFYFQTAATGWTAVSDENWGWEWMYEVN